MAKRGRQETRLNAAADGIGTGLGRLAARYDVLVRQRDELAHQLADYLRHVEKLLDNLGRSATVKAGRKERQADRAFRHVKRRFSPAARAKLRAAAKARWAAAKKAGKKTLG